MRALAIVAALATPAAADKDSKPIEDPSALETLLEDEEMVKQFATVGYPIADEISPSWDCETDPIDVGFPRYEQGLIEETSHAEIPFDVGLTAQLALASYSDQLGVSMVAEPYVEAFTPGTQTPVGVNVHADLYPDGFAEVDVRILALGYIVETFDQRVPGDVAYARAFGYQLPLEPGDRIAVERVLRPECECLVGFSMTPTTYAYVAGVVSAQSGAGGIQARALLSALSYSDLAMHPWALRQDWDTQLDMAGRIDLLRFKFGGRMQLLPTADGGWVGDTETRASVWKSMDALSRMRIYDPKRGILIVPLFQLFPMEHDKAVKIACKLQPKFPIKTKP